MNYYLTLKGWTGTSPDRAAVKMAKVFRMDPSHAFGILQELRKGGWWQFENQVTANQASIAETYLHSLGFQVERRPDDTPNPAPARTETTAILAPALAAGTPALPAGLLQRTPPGATQPMHFNGAPGDLWGLYAKNWILTLLTLGVYYFWGKTEVRKFLWGHFSVGEDRFSFHGRGRELLLGWLVFAGLAGLLAGSIQWLKQADPRWGSIVENVAVGGFAIWIPGFMVGAFRYRLSRTDLRGIRFSFRGRRRTAIWLNLKGMVLNVLTLGLYSPVYLIQMTRFWRSNLWFGNREFDFSGRWRDIFKVYLAAWAATICTLGLALPCWFWVQAYFQRYIWGHTHCGDAAFEFTATGWEFWKLRAGNSMILVLTLGLGYAWVVTRNLAFTADHLFLTGVPDWDRVVQEMKKTGALSESGLDALDAPLDVF